jgi:type II secretory pathway predicted ATPase ExeA
MVLTRMELLPPIAGEGEGGATVIFLCIGNFTISSRTPFIPRQTPACFFPNPHHEDALATLIDSLHKHRGMGAILGDAGLGKTLLLHVYLTLAQQRQYKTIYVADTDLTFRNLLQVLYQALGLDFPTATLDMLLAACQQHSVILAIDDAHLMPTLTFRKLWTPWPSLQPLREPYSTSRWQVTRLSTPN